MSCGIYKITNNINGYCYIGQSINIEQRQRKEQQRAFLPHSNEYNRVLSKAFRKYGLENFSFEILEECSVEELDEKEIFYIQKFDSYFNGYNATLGGQAGNHGNNMRISNDELLEIYDLLLNTNISQKVIAEKYKVGYDTISTINQGKTRRLDGYEYPLRNYEKKYYCIDCGKELNGNNRLRCWDCNIKERRKNFPEREILKQLIRNKSFLEIGRQYGVSDNAVRKWCKTYQLPSRKKDINTFSDEDWLKV